MHFNKNDEVTRFTTLISIRKVGKTIALTESMPNVELCTKDCQTEPAAELFLAKEICLYLENLWPHRIAQQDKRMKTSLPSPHPLTRKDISSLQPNATRKYGTCIMRTGSMQVMLTKKSMDSLSIAEVLRTPRRAIGNHGKCEPLLTSLTC